MMMEKIPVSCIVVYNDESDLIVDCIKSISFCSEITILDISGTTLLSTLLKGLPVKIVPTEKQLIVELLRQENINTSAYNWVLLIDPDERVDPKLKDYLFSFFKTETNNFAGIEVPWVFYFKGKQLRGTFWGNKDFTKLLLYDKTKYKYSNKIHTRNKLLNPEDSVLKLERSVGVLHHFWSPGYKQLIAKHKRYLQFEGEHKYKSGTKYDGKRHFKGILTDFYDSYVIYKGWKDGVTGLLLSSFYTWYRFSVWSAIKEVSEKDRN